jgi:hypothetical protein
MPVFYDLSESYVNEGEIVDVNVNDNDFFVCFCSLTMKRPMSTISFLIHVRYVVKKLSQFSQNMIFLSDMDFMFLNL